MKVFHAVTGQFRESRYGFGAWSTFTYNQFVFTYVYSFPFTDFKKVLDDGGYHRNSKDDENELKSSGYMTQTVDDNGEAQYEESDDDIDELFDADEDYGDGNSEQY